MVLSLPLFNDFLISLQFIELLLGVCLPSRPPYQLVKVLDLFFFRPFSVVFLMVSPPSVFLPTF